MACAPPHTHTLRCQQQPLEGSSVIDWAPDWGCVRHHAMIGQHDASVGAVGAPPRLRHITRHIIIAGGLVLGSAACCHTHNVSGRC